MKADNNTHHTIAAIDLGQVNPITITNGNEACVISGRKQLSPDEKGKLRLRLKKTKSKNRRKKIWDQLRQAVPNRHQKATDIAIQWATERQISTLAIGTFAGKTKFHKSIDYLRQNAAEAGIDVVLVPESNTTQTCPRCGNRNPTNGKYHRCSCGLELHRDVVGGINIRNQYLYGELIADDRFQIPLVEYLSLDECMRGGPVNDPS